MPDPAEILAKHWPYGGPHDRDTVRTAAESVVGLVRYLANATDPVNARATLETAGDVHRVVAALHEAVGFLPQLLAQLERAVDDMAAAGALRDSRVPEEAFMGRETARDVVSALSEVLPAVNFLSARLSGVIEHSAHLGNVEPVTAGPTSGDGPR
jgi:hypothetical protein